MIASTRRPLNRRLVLALAAGAMFAGTAALAAPPANTIKPGLFSGRADTAILGYDPVAYFTDGKPVKGQDNLVFDYLGAKWKFVSQSHLDLFKADPEKYAPQYGGYCAYGVTQDALASIEPDKFKILAWGLEPGDAVFFHMLTLHGAGGVAGGNRRRVVSFRFIGDDTTFAPRPWRTSPPFPGLADELQKGASMDHPLFPVLWRR